MSRSVRIGNNKCTHRVSAGEIGTFSRHAFRLCAYFCLFGSAPFIRRLQLAMRISAYRIGLIGGRVALEWALRLGLLSPSFPPPFFYFGRHFLRCIVTLSCSLNHVSTGTPICVPRVARILRPAATHIIVGTSWRHVFCAGCACAYGACNPLR